MSDIPIVIISWNQLTFLKSFLQQIKKFNHPIIILDNNSTYQPLLDFYDQMKDPNIKIHRLDKNYGHLVYKTLSHLLPDIYILSDPDLILNENMPNDAIEQLLKISNKYKSPCVGVALDISEYHKFIKGDYGKLVYKNESMHYNDRLHDDQYILYRSDTDTTFCLINKNYPVRGIQEKFGKIRVGGVFTAKHPSWYENYLKENIPQDELKVWVQNNKSSSILRYINPNVLFY